MYNSNKYLVYVRFIVIIEVHLSLNRGLPSSHETTAWARGPSRNHPLVARFMGHRRLNDEEARSAAPGPIWRASARKSASRSLETDESSSVFAPFTGGDCFGGEFPPLYTVFDLLADFPEPSLDFLANIPRSPCPCLPSPPPPPSPCWSRRHRRGGSRWTSSKISPTCSKSTRRPASS